MKVHVLLEEGKTLCGIKMVSGARRFNHAPIEDLLSDLRAGSADGEGYDLVSSKWCAWCIKKTLKEHPDE
jgi:hypothetical protein